MSQCEACHAAQTNPHAALYHSGCKTCAVRQVSNAPIHIREQFYKRIGDPAERVQFKADVADEYRRRAGMR